MRRGVRFAAICGLVAGLVSCGGPALHSVQLRLLTSQPSQRLPLGSLQLQPGVRFVASLNGGTEVFPGIGEGAEPVPWRSPVVRLAVGTPVSLIVYGFGGVGVSCQIVSNGQVIANATVVNVNHAADCEAKV
jgi:hypothetical protein